MLLYLLTSEGVNREDGNVYYAKHLVVDTDPKNRVVVDKLLDEVITAGGFTGENLYFTATETQTDEQYSNNALNNTELLVAHLVSNGFAARFVEPIMIIQDKGY